MARRNYRKAVVFVAALIAGSTLTSIKFSPTTKRPVIQTASATTSQRTSSAGNYDEPIRDDGGLVCRAPDAVSPF